MFLDACDERCDKGIHDIGKEHLVDDESDGEDDDRREMGSDETEQEGTLELGIGSEFLQEGECTVGMDEDIAFFHESEKYRYEEDYDGETEHKCLKYRPQGTFRKCHDDTTIHRDENSEDEDQIYG